MLTCVFVCVCVYRECFNGLGKVAKDFYTWWDTKREENAAIGILVAIGVILLCIFILLPAAFALLIVAGVLVISAVIIDAIYGKEESATPKASTEAAPSTEAADEKV